MGSVGDCYHNTLAESLFAVLVPGQTRWLSAELLDEGFGGRDGRLAGVVLADVGGGRAALHRAIGEERDLGGCGVRRRGGDDLVGQEAVEHGPDERSRVRGVGAADDRDLFRAAEVEVEGAEESAEGGRVLRRDHPEQSEEALGGLAVALFPRQQGEDIQSRLLAAAVAISLMITGSGAWSKDLGLLLRD